MEIQIKEETRIPGTDIVLERGDIISIVCEDIKPTEFDLNRFLTDFKSKVSENWENDFSCLIRSKSSKHAIIKYLENCGLKENEKLYDMQDFKNFSWDNVKYYCIHEWTDDEKDDTILNQHSYAILVFGC